MRLTESIECWRINYGLVGRTRMEAAQWWRDQAGGKDIAAPVGAILALAAAIDKIEKMQVERDLLVGHLDCMLDYVCESNAWRMVGACSAIAKARATLDEINHAATSCDI